MTPPRRRAAELLRIYDDKGQVLPAVSGKTYSPGVKVLVETNHIRAAIHTSGYVSGVAAGTFLDKKTGASDLGFGLSVVDFLLEPAAIDAVIPDSQYEFGPDHPFHGNIPKRYVEGPQICTQAKSLPARVFIGADFAAVRLAFEWNIAYAPHIKAGSKWEQTLIFPANERFFLSADRVTTVAQSPELFLRIDMPGHIKHTKGDTFDHVYLSYQDSYLPSTEFAVDFPPDAKFLYRRGEKPTPSRFVRAYQVDLGPGKNGGPWLAGMTLNPDDVYQAWCHERGYVCMIEEIGGRATKPGDVFGAAYLIGWFDDLAPMNAAYDRFKGASGWAIDGPAEKPTGYRGIPAAELATKS